MSIIIVVALILLNMMLYFFARKSHEANNPILLYILGWTFPLLLNQTRLSSFQKDFQSETWILICLSMVAFVSPILLILFSKKVTDKDRDILIYPEHISKSLFIFGTISIIIMCINWVILGGIPFFAGDTQISHLENAKFTSYFIYMLPLLSGIAVFYYILGGRSNRLLLYLIIISPYIFAVLHLLRSFILFAIYYQLSFAYCALRLKGINQRSVIKRIIKFVIPMVFILLISMPIIGNIRLIQASGGSISTVEDDLVAKFLGLKFHNPIFGWFYWYYSMGFDNLDLCIETHDGKSWLYGYNTFLSIIGPTQMKNIWYNRPEDISVARYWNNAVGTYLRELYLDGGIIYSLIVITFFSVIVSIFYIMGVRFSQLSMKWYAPYIVLGLGIVYMFFNSGAMFQPTVPLNVLISFIIFNKFSKSVKNNA